uniref:Carboxypeptidase n=1 Tax=Octactis speculum TaxID=3111310 RepID=A0A7S2G3G5_9STRA
MIQEFYKRFPSFSDSDFYLSAESYGGHYIPTLTKQIVAGSDSDINFKGFAVGNPYTDPVENMRGMFGSLYGHSLLPGPLYTQWEKECGEKGGVETYYADDKCISLEEDMWDLIGDVDWYGLSFPVCNAELGLSAQAQQLIKYSHPKLYTRLSKYAEAKKAAAASFDETTAIKSLENDVSQTPAAQQEQNAKVASLATGVKNKALGYDACVADYMTRYLNKEEVKVALHADTSITWAECTDSITYDFDDQMDYMEVLYKEFLTETDLKIMVFSGDDDSVCSTHGTQSWIWKLGLEVVEEWKAWYYVDPEYGAGQVGGYKVSWKGPGNATLTFVTVHDSGHEVPMYQPMKGHHVFANYIHGIW